MKRNNYTFSIFFAAMAITMVVAPNMMADFKSASASVAEQAESTSKSLMTAIVWAARIGGTGFTLWGLYDLFIAEDPQKQGKKTDGSMKVIGGILFILLGSFIQWASGYNIGS